MKKYLKWIVLALVVVIVAALGIVWANLNGIVRRTVETQTTSSLDLQTTLGGASVSIFGGNLGLKDLKIASPPGYKAVPMFALGQAGVNVSFGDLRGDPVHIKHITLDSPRVVIEANGTKLNFQAIMDQQSKTPVDPKSGSTEPPMKVVIDQLDVTSAQIALRPGVSIPGIKEEYAITLPSITLKNIGSDDSAKNGVAIKEVVVLLLTTFAQKAAESDQLPPELKQLLSLNVAQVAAQLGKRAQEELTKQVGKIGGEVGKQLEGALKEKDPGKAIEKGIGDLLGGGKEKKKPTTSEK
ncbi:MAG: AsmA family protein [Anaerolineae bacterium]|nr:AsmA family protein [Phycisphaerae bacterium]